MIGTTNCWRNSRRSWASLWSIQVSKRSLILFGRRMDFQGYWTLLKISRGSSLCVMVGSAFFALLKRTSHQQLRSCLTTSSIYLLMKRKFDTLWSAARIQSHHQSSRLIGLSSWSIRNRVLPPSHRCNFGKEKADEDDNRHSLLKEILVKYSWGLEENLRGWSYGLLVKLRRKDDLPWQDQRFLE